MSSTKRLGWLVALAIVASGCQAGSRPTEPDLDADGLPDSVETSGWNVTVRRTVVECFSGLAQSEEVRTVRSNEVLIDTDADGADDFAEFQLRSDPQDNDTDDDGLTDGREIELRESSELYAGAFLRLHDADSDDDCLSDGQEMAGINIPGIGVRRTDPTFFNTDGDAWSDSHEIFRSMTDPTNTDTDGDGAQDHFDVDPLSDVWIQFDFLKIFLETSPTGGQRADIYLDWYVPTKEAAPRPTPRPTFNVAVNQETVVPGNNSPGLLDLNDEQGGPLVQLNIQSMAVTGPSRAVGIDINPYHPGQPVTMQYNIANSKWAFQKSDGTWTPETDASMLDGSGARLWFALSTQPAP